MRRLFSMFARGAPGVGLLIMRGGAGGALLLHGIGGLANASAPIAVALNALSVAAGALLIAGLWTPIVAALAAIDAVGIVFSSPAEAGYYILVGILAAALALLGPGAWSIDARLFGLKRVEIPNNNTKGGDSSAP